jgi:DNA-binding beta-propeller fold protein YncE
MNPSSAIGKASACGIVLAALVTASALAPAAFGQEAKAKPPKYPHVTLATWYQVDPSWPQKPSQCNWSDMPGIAVDDHDQIYVYTRAVPPVQVYDSSGKFVRGWGEDAVKKAHHIKFDSKGMVWISDIGNHTVMQFTPEGKLLKTLGTRGVAGNDNAHFDQPTDMAITPDGQVFVSDGYGNSRVVHFDRDGRYVKSWGKLGTAPGEFSIPHAIALDSKGRIYVADRNNVRVQVFEQSGKFVEEWRDIIVPWGFWVSKEDDIWVCGSTPMPWRKEDTTLGCPPKDQVFMKFNTAGRVLQVWTVPKGNDGQEKPGELNWVHCVALDSQGNIYAGDIIGKRAQKFVRQH